VHLDAGRLRLRVRCHDHCWLDEADVLHDDIDMRFLGVPVGKITIIVTRLPLAGRVGSPEPSV
jgi:hypothetical protein